MKKTEQDIGKYVGHLAKGALRFRNELSVGTEAPHFQLPALDGSTFRLSDYRGKSNLVLIFGSFTCGSTITQLRAGNPPIGLLHRRFNRKGFKFILIYSVEMHPGEYLPRPTNPSWTWAPDLEQALTELVACERAKAKKEMVRMCYSEKLVGLTRNKKISAQVHRRAGPKAVKTFAALLQKERTKS